MRKKRTVGRPKSDTEPITPRVSHWYAKWLRRESKARRQTLGGVIEYLIDHQNALDQVEVDKP